MRANPTVLLFSILLSAFSADLLIACKAQQPGWPALSLLLVLQCLVVFALYIVAHDCAHRTASKVRVVNEGMLFACGVIFLLDGWVYRRIHLTHHAHTNEPADPDRFTAGRTVLVRWLKSFLIGGAYYVYALRHVRSKRHAALHLLFSPVLIGGLVAAFHLTGRTSVFVAGWLLPVFISMGFLGFVLTAWPHHPAEDTSRIGNAKNLDVPRVLQWLLGNQHLHLVHHYAPSVPWHKLPAYWREHKDDLVAKGAEPIP